jgi:hypothetical protein
MKISPYCNIDEIIRAVLRQAMVDYLTGGELGQDAMDWFNSQHGEAYCDYAGLNSRTVITRLYYRKSRKSKIRGHVRRMVTENVTVCCT